MRPGRAADHSPPSSAAVMVEYSYSSTHRLGHTGPYNGITLPFFYRTSGLYCYARALHLFGAEPFVFQVAIKKFKDQHA